MSSWSSSVGEEVSNNVATVVSTGFQRVLQRGGGSAIETVPIYEDCASKEIPLECISDMLELRIFGFGGDANTWFLVFASALIFFLQAGFAMLCAGSVRIKNVGNTMLKNMLDACGAAIGFYTVGYAFAFGQSGQEGTTFIGSTNFFLQDVDNIAFWLFQFAFAATSATIVAVAHSLWSGNGFLSAFNQDPFLGVGAVDFAGSAVVHMTGGCTAIFATMILGPRKGRFYDARGHPLPTPKAFPGHSVALQMLGTFILWFGWYGFNPGSSLALDPGLAAAGVAAVSAINTTLSAAAAGVTALFTNLLIEERTTGEAKFDLVYLMNGCLGGLVATTAGCAVLEPWAALVSGIFAGWIYLVTHSFLIRVRLDDAVDAIPVHYFCGMWGMLSVGLFASPQRMLAAYGTDVHVGWFYSLATGSFDASLMAAQSCAILFVTGWVFFLMFPFFIWLNFMGWFRADSLEELVGLDISYHGGGLGGNDEVKVEFVEAFKRRRENNRADSTRDTTHPNSP